MGATTQNTMSRQEVDDEFKDVELRFAEYYKYTFTFAGTADDGRTIEAGFSGDADDTYRTKLKAGDTHQFLRCNAWSFVRVFDGSRLVFEWNED